MSCGLSGVSDVSMGGQDCALHQRARRSRLGSSTVDEAEDCSMRIRIVSWAGS